MPISSPGVTTPPTADATWAHFLPPDSGCVCPYRPHWSNSKPPRLNGIAFTLSDRPCHLRSRRQETSTSSPTTTTLASSLNPANVGVSVTFTATVNGAAPTGTVSFTADGSPLCSSVAFSGGSGNTKTAACSSSALAVGSHSIVATYSGDAANQASFNAPALSQGVNASTDVIWFDDVVPAGATQTGTAEGWTWVSSSPAPFSSALAHQSALLSDIHQHYFYDATATLSVGIGDTLYAYVYLDPVNPPSEVTLQWNNGTWEHRAYWGANLNDWGIDGTNSRRYMGALPATGQWVRLSVPAALVGLEGTSINGMAFTLYDGRATWDRAGKSTGTSSPTTTTLASSLNPANVGVSVTFTATVNGSAPTGTVSFTADGSPLCSSVAFSGGSGNTKTAACSSSTLVAGSHSIVATYSGDAANQSSFNAPALSQRVNAGGGSDVVWFDDIVPAGATQTGTAEGWTWVSSNPAPFSGSLAHQSALLSGLHQHHFYNATTTLSVSTGDTLYTYVYLDPVNPPSEVMLQWNNGTWEHRAYWGANLIAWGDDATNSRRYMGALPATGQWVRLSVPAALVGLEATTLNGMAFTLSDGRATFDRAGKSTGTSSPTTTTLASSLNPANVGVSVTFTATVNGAAPTGTVSFTADGSPLCSSVAFSGGSGNTKTAACSSSTLVAGSHSIVATYSGDAANQSSFNTPALSQTVNAGGGSDVVWFDDVVPAGATQTGTGEGWTWVSSNPRTVLRFARAPVGAALRPPSASLL